MAICSCGPRPSRKTPDFCQFYPSTLTIRPVSPTLLGLLGELCRLQPTPMCGGVVEVLACGLIFYRNPWWFFDDWHAQQLGRGDGTCLLIAVQLIGS